PQPASDPSESPIGDSNVVDDDADIAWLNTAENGEVVEALDVCVERWKSAGPEARKKMFALFAIAGVFLSVCCHGHVLVICDMICSGELMKYLMAVINRLFDSYRGDIALGYDIMCAFVKTLANSSLKQRVIGMRLQGVVPAFHGHAHNRTCQCHWHPMYMDGVGLEDFEECERTFAKSNELAAVTRLATPYHRHQQIDEHFRFHDDDKYACTTGHVNAIGTQWLEYFEECERTFAKSNELAAVTRLATPYHRHQQIDEHFRFHDDDKYASSGE
ncbi:hypothetical protein CVT25_001370, partial [Psilocybe cyanescens]